MAEDLNAYRDKKNGTITPQMISESLRQWVDQDLLETVLYIGVTHEGEFIVGRTDGFITNHVGYLEVVKQQLIESLRE